MNDSTQAGTGQLPHIPWNKGKLIGQKPPLKLQEIWAIRIRLQILKSVRDLALFNLAIDSKLRGCDLVLSGWPTSLTARMCYPALPSYSGKLACRSGSS